MRRRRNSAALSGGAEGGGTAQRIPEESKKEEGERRKGRASVGRALRNAGEQAIKTEICLSAASSFPFSRNAGVLARSDAALIFLFANFFFSSRKRKSGPQPLGKRNRKIV